jgi:hypothetical protein
MKQVRLAAGLVAALGWGTIAVPCDMAPGSPGTAHLVLDVFGYLQ